LTWTTGLAGFGALSTFRLSDKVEEVAQPSIIPRQPQEKKLRNSHILSMGPLKFFPVFLAAASVERMPLL
jgi:hypothetical protein